MSCAAILFLTIAHLGYMITEFVVISTSTNAMDECGPFIFYCVMVCATFHLFQFIAGFIYLASLNDDRNTITKDKLFKLFALYTVANGIWSMICLYYTDSECVDNFINEYKKLWGLVIIEVYTFYGSVGLTIIYKIYKRCRATHHNQNGIV
jgi:hypothetical protein